MPDSDGAACRYLEALSVATECGMRPLVAHCHVALGKLYRRTGKTEQAQEHLATGFEMYRQMGMQLWLKQVDAELDGQSPSAT